MWNKIALFTPLTFSVFMLYGMNNLPEDVHKIILFEAVKSSSNAKEALKIVGSYKTVCNSFKMRIVSNQLVLDRLIFPLKSIDEIPLYCIYSMKDRILTTQKSEENMTSFNVDNLDDSKLLTGLIGYSTIHFPEPLKCCLYQQPKRDYSEWRINKETMPGLNYSTGYGTITPMQLQKIFELTIRDVKSVWNIYTREKKRMSVNDIKSLDKLGKNCKKLQKKLTFLLGVERYRVSFISNLIIKFGLQEKVNLWWDRNNDTLRLDIAEDTFDKFQFIFNLEIKESQE